MRAVTPLVFLLISTLFGDSVDGSDEQPPRRNLSLNRGTRQRLTSGPDTPRRSLNPITPRIIRNPPNSGQGGQEDSGRSTSVRVGIPEHVASSLRNRRPTQGETQGHYPRSSSSNLLPRPVIQDEGHNQHEHGRSQHQASSSGHTDELLSGLARLRVHSDTRHEEQAIVSRIDVSAPNIAVYAPRTSSRIFQRGIRWLYRQMEYLNIPDITFYTERGLHEPPRKRAAGFFAAWEVQPARLRDESEAHLFPLGTIVKYHDFHVIIVHDAERGKVTCRLLTEAEKRILERIIRRKPTDPKQYQIMPVEYQVHDRLVGPARAPGSGLELYGECHVPGVMSDVISDDPALSDVPMAAGDKFLLFRKTQQYVGQLREFIFDHLATHTDDMWVPVDLLPTAEERAFEERRIQRQSDRRPR